MTSAVDRAALVRAVIQATDDGDHHPPISQWAAERAVEVVMGARLEVESEPVGYCNPEHLTRIRREAGARGEAASTIYGYPAGTYTTPLYARPAPTVEEVARVMEECIEESLRGGMWTEVRHKHAARIHALWTGEKG